MKTCHSERLWQRVSTATVKCDDFHGWKRTKWKHFLPANCLITIYGFMTVNPHCTYAALWRLKLSATRTVRLTACPLVTGGFPWQMSSNADSFPGHDIIMVIIRKYSWWLSITDKCRHDPHNHNMFNSLAPGKFEWQLRYLIFQIITVIDGWGISC